MGSPEDLQAREGSATVIDADLASCTAVATGPFDLPAAPRARLVKAGDAAKLRLRLEPEDSELARSLSLDLLEIVDGKEDLALIRRADGSRVVADDLHGTGADGGPVLVAIPPASMDRAERVVQHYASYIAPVRVARRCTDLAGMLHIQVLDCAGVVTAGEAAQEIDLEPITSEANAGDLVCYAVENTGDVVLSVTLILCAPSGAVEVLGEQRIPDGGRFVFWNGGVIGVPFGLSRGVQRLVAIGTTSTTASFAYLATATTFASLLAPPMRGRGGAMRSAAVAPAVPVDEWTSAMTSVLTKAATT
jgi:hypothetical protein